MGFNRKVVRQQGLGFTTLDFNALRKQQVERDQMLAEAAKLENERLNEEKIAYERDAALKANHRALMKNYRGAGINALAASIPNAILAECFNTVFVKALPHDTDYVDENIKTIKNMGAMYVKKIGGVKALAESTNRTNSPFLRALLEFCNEFSQAIIMERVKEINEAETEEEIKEMISPQLNDEERNTILVKMDKLGSDELAEMISNKVIDVVRDEQQREKDQAEILDTMEKDMNEDPNDVKVDDREDTTADDVAEAAKHVAETYNPLTRTFNYDKKDTNKSFFFSLMQGIATKVLKESTQTESTKVETPQILLENPLNLNIFDVYMQDKNEDLDDLRPMDMTDTGEIARTTSLDKHFILSEALLEYTMFETAHTMKLVNITLDDIRQQADYMRKGC